MEDQPQSAYHKHSRLALAIVLLVAVVAGVAVLFAAQYTLQSYVTGEPTTTPVASTATEVPQLNIETVLDGLDHPWDIAFLPDGHMLFTQRGGEVNVLKDAKEVLLTTIPDVQAVGEGGLLGLAIDPKFNENRFIYTCYNSKNADVRVVRWKINSSVSGVEGRVDIVTGMPSNVSGRHSGCRLAFGPGDVLWIGTGDTAQHGRSPQIAQDPNNLGGKILRVDRDGKAAPGNLDAPFDSRIYSYGHRNTQGIAFLPKSVNGIIGFSAEHGSTVDDEVNVLKKGNFGWDSDRFYTEVNVPMTDKQKFPNAIDAAWRSGSPTQAPSGLAVIKGQKWKAWEGSLALAMLKAKHLKLLSLDSRGAIVKEERILTDKGRLRDVQQAPDGNLYVSTDNGSNKDQIIRLAPKP